MKILVPYDGSPPSLRAVEYALRIATAVGKPTVVVHLLNVQDTDAGVIDYFRRDAADVASRLVTARRDTGASLLDGPARTIEGADVRVERIVLLGDPADHHRLVRGQSILRHDRHGNSRPRARRRLVLGIGHIEGDSPCQHARHLGQVKRQRARAFAARAFSRRALRQVRTAGKRPVGYR